MTRRGRIAARPTNGIRAVDEQRHLGGQIGVFHARLGEELLNEFLPSAQMRQGGLANRMARALRASTAPTGISVRTLRPNQPPNSWKP